jgi:protein-disulfide isomerase
LCKPAGAERRREEEIVSHYEGRRRPFCFRPAPLFQINNMKSQSWYISTVVAIVSVIPLSAADNLVQTQKPVVAVVDGVEVTEDELKVEAQIVQLKKQEYELKMRALENTISRKIIDRAASAKNLTPEEFFRQEVDSKIPEPTANEIEGFYWGQRDKFRDPLDQVRDQVAQALQRAKTQEGRQALLQQLRQQAAVRMLLEPPRLAVAIGNAPRKGSPSAPVTIVEFSDYQCPFCKRTQATLQQLAVKYGDQVSFAFKDFPLNKLHPQAQAAAEAAHCAGEQGKYWEYHDALFGASALDPESLREAASQIPLDQSAFQACTAAGKYKERVESNSLEGRQLGVNSTPSFFVNGVFLSGSQPLAAFEKVINAEIEASKSTARQR